jgi:hypothetical protein
MGNGNFDPNDIKIQLEVMKERLKFSEEKLRQQEQVQQKVLIDLGRKDNELQRTIDERNKLRIDLAVIEQKLKYELDTKKLNSQQVGKKNTSAKVQAFLASLLFLSVSILAGFGTNFLTFWALARRKPCGFNPWSGVPGFSPSACVFVENSVYYLYGNNNTWHNGIPTGRASGPSDCLSLDLVPKAAQGSSHWQNQGTSDGSSPGKMRRKRVGYSGTGYPARSCSPVCTGFSNGECCGSRQRTQRRHFVSFEKGISLGPF